MYSPLNEDLMFQEMHDRSARISAGRGAHPTPGRPVVGGGGWRTVRENDRCADGPEQDPEPRRSGAELDALLRAATGPDGTRMVLLSGDAGVGKTRLLTEALAELAREGWHTLVGHCLDFGDTSMPYLPFAEMLGQAADAVPDLADGAAAHPALSRLRYQSQVDPAGSVADRSDRAEVFEAVYALLEELALDGPVVMVVEDAHWADASTRDLVSFLLSRRLRGRFLCIVTFRSDEMHRRHPLRQRVAEWVRLPGVERIQLEPLPAGAVRGMVEELIGSTGSVPGAGYDDDIERIVQRSQGNAFYVEELVGAFLGGGWSLPEDLADLLLVRLDRIEDSAREVVRVASAAGQRVSHDLLARVAPLSEDQLDRALREAIDANVLVRTGEQSYAFRHALLGEAVYDDLLPGERMRLHTAYAAAVRELHGAGGAANLARHALASHDLPTALSASIEAGDQALASGGPDEAARHFTKALEIYDLAAPRLEDPPDEVALVARTVEALCSSGRPETALSLVDSHLAQLPQDGPHVSRAVSSWPVSKRSGPPRPRPVPASSAPRPWTWSDPRTPSCGRGSWRRTRWRSSGTTSSTRPACARTRRWISPTGSTSRGSRPTSGSALTWLGQHLDFGEGSRAELKRIIEDARDRGDRRVSCAPSAAGWARVRLRRARCREEGLHRGGAPRS